MIRPCPECGGDLTDLEPAVEMTSQQRYWCDYCELVYVNDGSGTLFEEEP